MRRIDRRHLANHRTAASLLFAVACSAGAQAGVARAPVAAPATAPAPAPMPSAAAVSRGVAPAQPVPDLAFSFVVVDNVSHSVGGAAPTLVVTRIVQPAASNASRQAVNPCSQSIAFPLQLTVKNVGGALFKPLSSAQAVGVQIGPWGAAKDLVTLAVSGSQTMSFTATVPPGHYTLSATIDLHGQVAEARTDNKTLNWPLEVRCQLSNNMAAAPSPATGVAPMAAAARPPAPTKTMSSSTTGAVGAASPAVLAPAAGSNPGMSPSTSSKNGGTGAMISANYVPAPTGLTNTQDQKACTDHGGFGGGLACAAGLPAGKLVLIWTCQNCKVNGYHLFRVDNGQHTRLPSNGAYSSSASVTLAMLDAPADGFNGKCYAVAAYNGMNESKLSDAYCAGGGSVQATMTLQPAHALRWELTRGVTTGAFGKPGDPTDVYDGTLFVGHAFSYQEATAGDLFINRVNRSGLYFDLSQLAGRTVTKAVLQLVAKSSWHGYTSVNKQLVLSNQSPQACVTTIDKATDHWWENNNLASTVSYSSPGAIMGPSFTMDVTSAIQSWLTNGASNYGFVLRGDNENNLYTGNRSDVCLTQLEAVSLVVTYH